jgi:hypothetical protein
MWMVAGRQKQSIGKLKRWRRRALASAAAGVLMTAGTVSLAQPLAARPKLAVKACSNAISACGCTIIKPGFYQVTANLMSSQGLTAKDGCIDVLAANVVLTTGAYANGTPGDTFDITGAGGATPTGIGLHILRGSNDDVIELPSALSGWDVGILVEGNANVVEGFEAEANGTAGIELNDAQKNNINDFSADSNNNYGMWLKQSSNNQINSSSSDSNVNVAVYIGCSASGPVSAKCKGVANSLSNRIFDHTSAINGKYGFVIDLGDSGNIVTNSNNFGATIDDVFDANLNCAKNQWFYNTFTTRNASCIQ